MVHAAAAAKDLEIIVDQLMDIVYFWIVECCSFNPLNDDILPPLMFICSVEAATTNHVLQLLTTSRNLEMASLPMGLL